MPKLNVRGGVNAPYYQAVIEVDCDPDAENLLIFDRTITNYSAIKAGLNGGVVKIIVPLKYSNLNDLIVGISDNDRTYASKFADGVKPQVIDGKVVNILL
ncbi:hypothetical protein [Shewanella colwelliana]|uniref:hypothetical protein n=1 Tax=Shewanella colwelliana TaxID=23 RepID=UPI0022B07014|nr:hypothetical protein [Shewanella colwelliana]MCZ4339659.1 hypothetical protein [Shewanella colwelliana]